MKYIVRALKYFVYITVIMCLILVVMRLLGFTHSLNPAEMFRLGWKSVWQILGIFLVFSLLYPRMGYTRRNVSAPGEYGELRGKVVEFFEGRGYRLENEEGENMTFRMTKPLNRISRSFEDRITLTRSFGGWEIEGITKDVVRLVYGLESSLAATDNIS